MTGGIAGSTMTQLLALSVHAAVFWALVASMPPNGVLPAAWVVAYLAGTLLVLLLVRKRAAAAGARQAAALLLYAVVLAACFGGADFALNTLGNSARPRVALPPWLGGLELYILLMPGVASAALGAWLAHRVRVATGWLGQAPGIGEAGMPRRQGDPRSDPSG